MMSDAIDWRASPPPRALGQEGRANPNTDFGPEQRSEKVSWSGSGKHARCFEPGPIARYASLQALAFIPLKNGFQNLPTLRAFTIYETGKQTLGQPS